MKVLFEQKIRLAFSLALAFLLVLACIAWWSAARSIAAFRSVDQTHQVLDELDEISIGILNAETSVRGYALRGDESYLKPYASGVATLKHSRKELQRLSRDNELLQAKVGALEPLLDKKLGSLAAIIQERRANGLEAASKLLTTHEGDALMEQVRNVLAEIGVMERHLLDKRSAKAQNEGRSTISLVIFGSLAAMLLVAGANALVQRDFRKRLKAEAERDRLFDAQKQVEMQIVELNADLQVRAAELAAVNKELEAFSYSVSHDLRAPLRHVSGFVDLLKKNVGASLDKKALHHLDCIATSAHQMGQLVDDLLQFSRMARAEMRFSRVDLGDLVAEVQGRLQHDLHGRKIEWKIGALPEVQGDRSMLRVVLTNLISNAVKYTRPRKPARIEIGCDANGKEHVVFVRDNGVGFDMKYVGKLFGVFQRLHFEEEFEGTGIGLASARRILMRHGGRIWAEGQEDQGATFYFSLPMLGNLQRAKSEAAAPAHHPRPRTFEPHPLSHA
jgi:signal transduction histidine kinase